MSILENILYQQIVDHSNIWYGIGIAILLVFILFGIITFIFRDRTLNFLSIALGILALPFLSFQMARLCGAIDVYNMLNNITDMASNVKETISGVTGISEDDANKALSYASSVLPGINSYVETFTSSLSDFSRDMLEQAYSFLYWYIARRILWSLCFIAVSAIGIIITMNKVHRQRHSSRYERITSRRIDEHRPMNRKSRR